MAGLVLQDLDDLKRRIAPHVWSAMKVIAFGSVARGESDQWSDLDLIIVAETARPFLERFKDFAGLYEVWPRLDLLIYPPEEFERRWRRRTHSSPRRFAKGWSPSSEPELRRRAGRRRPRAI